VRNAVRASSLSVCFVVALVTLAPGLAWAQSAIAGRVTDNTGGVLPGVTVEAKSPVLIEGSRVAVTGGQGNYTIVDLRPGIYTVTFTLGGFTTVIREGLALASDVTMPIDVVMRVGALEESITVTGDSPVVDVQQSQRVQVLSRDVIDSLPTARTLQGRAQLIPGIRMDDPDVGGSRSMQQTYMTVHGSVATEITVQVDGAMINGLQADGAVQTYINDAMSEEMSYQTSGIRADTAAGGIRLNMIPRDGGNTFSANFLAEGTWNDLVSSNLSNDLKNYWRLTSVDSVDRVYDINGTLGGPIVRDRLWFFTASRQSVADRPIADSFYQDGRPGLDDNMQRSALGRVTYQVSQKNKFSAHLDRVPKYRYHDHVRGEIIEETSRYWRTPLYGTWAAKWTSTLSSRVLVEASYSGNTENYQINYQLTSPSVDPATGRAWGRGTPQWFATASRLERTTNIRRTGTASESFNYPERQAVSASLSYVSGSHNFKFGVQNTWGDFERHWRRNADLQQEYRNGRPDTVSVCNCPVITADELRYDTGVYAQDAWTIDRLTLNLGVRFDFQHAATLDRVSPAGRFVGTRRFDPIEMPKWNTVSPRLGASYDLFGNAKTALKFSAGKYYLPRATGLADDYNPLTYITDRRTWRDLNGDDIAQDDEIGPANIDFSVARDTIDPDTKRNGNWEVMGGVQHEVRPGMAASLNFYRRHWFNFFQEDDLNNDLSNYTPLTVPNPLANWACPPTSTCKNPFNDTVTIYARNRTAVRNVLDTNTTAGSDLRRNVYKGFELSVDGRMGGAAHLFGAFTIENKDEANCDSPDNPNTFRFCDDNEPWQSEYKLAGDFTLPWDFQIAGTYQSYPPDVQIWNWEVPAAVFTANGLVRRGATDDYRVQLNDAGTVSGQRMHQIDLSFAKWLDLPGRARWKIGVDVYNILNQGFIEDFVSTVVDAPGPTFGRVTLGRPQEILIARFWKLSTRLQW